MVIVDSKGEELSEGYATFKAGHSYRISEISRLMEVCCWGKIIHTPKLEKIFGEWVWGAGFSVYNRANNGKMRNLYYSTSADILNTANNKFLLTLNINAGYQRDFRRLRYRMAWGLGFMWLPPIKNIKTNPKNVPGR